MLQTLRSWLKLAKKGHAAGRHPRHGRGVSRPLGLEVLESRLNPAGVVAGAEVANLFNYFLNRDPDPQGLSAWTARLLRKLVELVGPAFQLSSVSMKVVSSTPLVKRRRRFLRAEPS